MFNIMLCYLIHLRFCQGIFDYGKQHLHTALGVRRNLTYDLNPNHNLNWRLHEAWKRFSQGVNEKIQRLMEISSFNIHADQVQYPPTTTITTLVSRSVRDERGDVNSRFLGFINVGQHDQYIRTILRPLYQ